MTSKRSLTIKTRILTAFVLSLAALAVLIASAAAAQQRDADQPPARPQPAYAVARSSTTRQNARATASDNSRSFLPAVTYGSGGSYAWSVAVSDVNGDGKPDLIVANEGDTGGNTTVGVLLGNGDGTFQPAVTYESGGFFAFSVAVADVNQDGKPDLLVANSGSNTVGVLLGNGDGTFQAATPYDSGGLYAVSVAVADVNQDGKPDLVVANLCGGNLNCESATVAVLLGNGDGTFQPAVTYGSGGTFVASVAVSDVNGDGKPDLLVGNYDTGSVGVLLGNGDGTFQQAVAYGAGGTFSTSVAVADVNHDGKPDLLVANYCASSTCEQGGVGVLLGNGDGTFQPAVTYSSGGQYTASVAVADVNQDGKLDLVLGNGNNDRLPSSAGVLLGNGDGTFQPAVTYSSDGWDPFTDNATLVAVGDLNGDGRPDLLVANECISQSCVGGGSVGVLLNNTPWVTSTTVTSSQNPSTHGQSITFTATVTTSGPIAPTGTVNFKWGPDGIGQGTLNASGVATFTTSILKPGAYKITAVYKGDASNLTSTSAILFQGVKR